MKKAIKTQNAALILLIVISGYLHFIEPAKAWGGFEFSMKAFVDALPMFVVAIFLAGLIRTWVSKELIVEYLGAHRERNVAQAAVLGIITPGPVYSIYPIVEVIRDKGASSESITSYIFGQTMIGPMRVPLEIAFFSLPFLAYRIALAFVLAVYAGALSIIFLGLFPAYRVLYEMKDEERRKILNSKTKSLR